MREAWTQWDIKCCTCEFLGNRFKLLWTEIKVMVGVQGGEEEKALGAQRPDALFLLEGHSDSVMPILSFSHAPGIFNAAAKPGQRGILQKNTYHSMRNIFSSPVRPVPDVIMSVQPQRSSLDRDQPRGHRFLTCVPVRLFLQQMRAYLCLCNGGSGRGWGGRGATRTIRDPL